MSNKTIWQSAIFLAILTAALFFRIVAINDTVVDNPIRSDARQYYNYAKNLNEFGVFSGSPSGTLESPPTPDAKLGPVYPWILSFFTPAETEEKFINNVRYFQALLGILLVILVFVCAKFVLPTGLSLVVASLSAISPQIVNMNNYLLTEATFTALLFASLALLLIGIQNSKESGNWQVLLAGVFLALSTLTRPTTQYLAIFWVGILLVHDFKKFKFTALFLLAGFLLAYLPWMIRNIIIVGSASDSTLMLSTIVHGHYPNLMYNGDLNTLGYPYRADPLTPMLGRDLSSTMGIIWSRILQDPATYIHWYLVGKVFTFLDWNDYVGYLRFFTYPVLSSPYFDQPAFVASWTAMRFAHWLFVLFALISLPLILLKSAKAKTREKIGRPNISILLLAGTFVYFILLHMIGFPIARYSIPILPIIYTLAIYSLYNFYQYLHPTNAMPTPSNA